jgi:hypothetical protein
MLKARSRATKFSQLAALTLACVAVGLAAPRAVLADGSQEKGESHKHLGIQWVNHFDLLSGDPTVTTTSSLSTSSGVGGGLTALVITSSTTGDTDSFNGNKVVQMALELPQKTRIMGVRLCYELSNPGTTGSFIDQVRLAQIQDPPATALVLLDDPTAQNASGPTCVNSALVSSPIRSSKGSVLLSLRVFFANTADKIAVRAVGLLVKPQD